MTYSDRMSGIVRPYFPKEMMGNLPEKPDTTRRDIPLDIAFRDMLTTDLDDPIEVGEWHDPQCEIVRIDSNWPHGLPETGGAVGSGWTGEVPKKRGRGLSEGKPRIRQFKPKIQ